MATILPFFTPRFGVYFPRLPPADIFHKETNAQNAFRANQNKRFQKLAETAVVSQILSHMQ